MTGDEYFDWILERPQMFAGASVRTLEIVLLNLLNYRCLVFDTGCDPKMVLRRAYADRYGHSAGAGGPASKFIERFGDDPNHEEVIAFYKAVTETVLDYNAVQEIALDRVWSVRMEDE